MGGGGGGCYDRQIPPCVLPRVGRILDRPIAKSKKKNDHRANFRDDFSGSVLKIVPSCSNKNMRPGGSVIGASDWRVGGRSAASPALGGGHVFYSPNIFGR